MAPSPSATELVIAIEQAAQESMLSEVELRCGDVLRRVANTFEQVVDDEERCVLAEQIGQKPVLTALGKLLSKLTTLSKEEDSLLYVTSFVSNSCLVYSERACDLTSMALIDALFQVLNGMHDSDVRQLAAAALTSLDANGRLHSDASVQDKLVMFARGVETLLETASHIGFQEHVIYLLHQCSKSGNSHCRDKLREAARVVNPTMLECCRTLEQHDTRAQELESRYSIVDALTKNSSSPRALLNAYNCANSKSRICSTMPLEITVYGSSVQPHWIDWNEDDVYLQDKLGQRVDLLLNQQDLSEIWIERRLSSDDEGRCAEQLVAVHMKVRDPPPGSGEISMLFDVASTARLRDRVFHRLKDMHVDCSSIDHITSANSPEARALLYSFSKVASKPRKISMTCELRSDVAGAVSKGPSSDSNTSVNTTTARGNTVELKAQLDIPLGIFEEPDLDIQNRGRKVSVVTGQLPSSALQRKASSDQLKTLAKSGLKTAEPGAPNSTTLSQTSEVSEPTGHAELTQQEEAFIQHSDRRSKMSTRGVEGLDQALPDTTDSVVGSQGTRIGREDTTTSAKRNAVTQQLILEEDHKPSQEGNFPITSFAFMRSPPNTAVDSIDGRVDQSQGEDFDCGQHSVARIDDDNAFDNKSVHSGKLEELDHPNIPGYASHIRHKSSRNREKCLQVKKSSEDQKSELRSVPQSTRAAKARMGEKERHSSKSSIISPITEAPILRKDVSGTPKPMVKNGKGATEMLKSMQVKLGSTDDQQIKVRAKHKGHALIAAKKQAVSTQGTQRSSDDAEVRHPGSPRPRRVRFAIAPTEGVNTSPKSKPLQHRPPQEPEQAKLSSTHLTSGPGHHGCEESPAEVDGLMLHMSKSNKTGYKNVFRIGEEYVVQFSAEGKKQRTGGFTSALSAATAYAKLQRELATDSERLPARADSPRDEATNKPSDSRLHEATPRGRHGMVTTRESEAPAESARAVPKQAGPKRFVAARRKRPTESTDDTEIPLLQTDEAAGEMSDSKLHEATSSDRDGMVTHQECEAPAKSARAVPQEESPKGVVAAERQRLAECTNDREPGCGRQLSMSCHDERSKSQPCTPMEEESSAANAACGSTNGEFKAEELSLRRPPRTTLSSCNQQLMQAEDDVTDTCSPRPRRVRFAIAPTEGVNTSPKSNPLQHRPPQEDGQATLSSTHLTSGPGHHGCEESPAEVDGLTLHMSKSNKTGYKNVFRIGEEYVVQFSAEGKKQRTGGFTSALSAATAYAKLQRELATDSERLPARADSPRDESTNKPSDSRLHEAAPRDRRGMVTTRESEAPAESARTVPKQEGPKRFVAARRKRPTESTDDTEIPPLQTDEASGEMSDSKLHEATSSDRDGMVTHQECEAPAESARTVPKEEGPTRFVAARRKRLAECTDDREPGCGRQLSMSCHDERSKSQPCGVMVEQDSAANAACGYVNGELTTDELSLRRPPRTTLSSCNQQLMQAEDDVTDTCSPRPRRVPFAIAPTEGVNTSPKSNPLQHRPPQEDGQATLSSTHLTSGPGHHGCEESPAEVDGLTLHMSKSNKTGYKNVFRIGEEYVVQFSAEGKKQRTGGFTSALSAATAYAKLQRELATDSERLPARADSPTNKPSDSRLHEATPRDRRGMVTTREREAPAVSARTVPKQEGPKRFVAARRKRPAECTDNTGSPPTLSNLLTDEAIGRMSDSKLHAAAIREMMSAKERKAPAEKRDPDILRSDRLATATKQNDDFVAEAQSMLANTDVLARNTPRRSAEIDLPVEERETKELTKKRRGPLITAKKAIDAALQELIGIGEYELEYTFPTETSTDSRASSCEITECTNFDSAASEHNDRLSTDVKQMQDEAFDVHAPAAITYSSIVRAAAAINCRAISEASTRPKVLTSTTMNLSSRVVPSSGQSTNAEVDLSSISASVATAENIVEKEKHEMLPDLIQLNRDLDVSHQTRKLHRENISPFNCSPQIDQVLRHRQQDPFVTDSKWNGQLADFRSGTLPCPAVRHPEHLTSRKSMKRPLVTSSINPMEALLSMRTKFKDMQQQSGSPSKLRKICLTESTASIGDKKEVDDCELNFDDGHRTGTEPSSKNSSTGIKRSRQDGGTEQRQGVALSFSNFSTWDKEQCLIQVDIDHDNMALLQTIRTAIGCCSSKIRNAKELSASTAISMALSEMEKQFVQLKQHVQKVHHVYPKAATNLVDEYKSLKHRLCRLSDKAEILKAVESHNQANVNTEVCNLKRKRVAMEELNQYNRQFVEDQLQAEMKKVLDMVKKSHQQRSNERSELIRQLSHFMLE